MNLKMDLNPRYLPKLNFLIEWSTRAIEECVQNGEVEFTPMLIEAKYLRRVFYAASILAAESASRFDVAEQIKRYNGFDL